jgi:hypothetical protein
VVNGTNGKGSEGAEVDEGCSRVMKDRVKWMEGKKGSTEPEVFITGQCQINSRRIELPIIIGPQHRLHLGMAALSGGVKNH